MRDCEVRINYRARAKYWMGEQILGRESKLQGTRAKSRTGEQSPRRESKF